MNLQDGICPKCGRKLKLIASDLTGSTVVSFQCDYCLSQMKDFEIFVRCLSVAYKQFCLNEKMHKAIETELYDKFEQQWDAILIALEVDYKLWLGKILERKYTHKFLGNREFSGEDGITESKIMNWRHDFLAHFNFKKLRDYKNFVETNPLDPDSIRNLFYKIAEVTDQYNRRNDKLISSLKKSFQQIEKEASIECDKWLDNFKKV